MSNGFAYHPKQLPTTVKNLVTQHRETILEVNEIYTDISKINSEIKIMTMKIDKLYTMRINDTNKKNDNNFKIACVIAISCFLLMSFVIGHITGLCV